MNADYEKRLEDAIDRELKSLPELAAPAGLGARVMATLQCARTAPWYRQSWEHWPWLARVAAIVFLAGFFGALCFGVWKAPDTQAFAAASQEVARRSAGLYSLWSWLNSVAGVLVLAVRRMGDGVVFGCLGAIALAWSMFLGIGGAFLRMAFARR